MPVQYIIGEWEFRDITLKMVPPVFIPRPETEILVDIVLRRVAAMKENELNVLDIGCGSGAISLALVHASSKVAIAGFQFFVCFLSFSCLGDRDFRIFFFISDSMHFYRQKYLRLRID